MAEASRWQAEEMPRLPEAATCEERPNLNMDNCSPQPRGLAREEVIATMSLTNHTMKS